MKIPLLIKKLRPGVQTPAYKTKQAAGFDLHAEIPEAVTLAPMGRKLIGTGLAFDIPPGYEGQVRPRSGLALKNGLSIVNTPGTIDADYRGEVGVLLINLGDSPVEISPGERIAQMIVAPVVLTELVVVETLSETSRNAGGFGSTGA